MKKLLAISTLLACAGTAFAQAPAYANARTDYDRQFAYSLEGLYASPSSSDAMGNMWGGRFGMNFTDNQIETFRHQWKLDVLYLTGNKKETKWKSDHDVMGAMFGYFLNIAVADNVLVYVGGQLGAAKVDMTYKTLSADGRVEKSTANNDTAFSYTFGGGIRFQASDTVQLNIGYEYQRIEIDDAVGMHVISAGVSCNF